MEVTFIRHGAIEGAGDGVFYGFTDYPLSQKGMEQARVLGRRLKGSFDKIYCSPASRAIATMDIACNEAGIDISQAIFDQRIKEMNFGEAEGYTYEELCKKFPQIAEKMDSNWNDFSFNGGESPRQFMERVASFVNDTIKEDTKSCQRIAVFCHGGTVRSALSSLMDMGNDGFWRFKCYHCSRSIIEIDESGYAVLSLLNAM